MNNSDLKDSISKFLENPNLRVNVTYDSAGSICRFSLEDPDYCLEKEVSKWLRRFGIPCHLKGYKMLMKAIIIVIDDFPAIYKPWSLLYPLVAEEFNSTPKRVERNIRHAIEVGWKNTPDIAASRRKRPANSEFISVIADEILMSK